MIVKKLKNLENKDIRVKNDFPPPPYNPNLPKPYFLQYVVGSRGSGKSTAIINEFNKMHSYLTYSYIVSPTIHNDLKQRDAFIGRENVNVYTDLSEETLLEIISEIKAKIKQWKEYHNLLKIYNEFKKKGYDVSKIKPYDLIKLYECDFNPHKMEMALPHKPHFLIFIDDGQGSPIFYGHKTNSPFNKFVIQHRHFFTSIIISVQSYKGNSAVFRQQMSSMLLFRVRDSNRLGDIFKEVEGNFENEDEFMSMYNFATKDNKFDFLYIDLDAKEDSVRKNFNEVLK